VAALAHANGALPLNTVAEVCGSLPTRSVRPVLQLGLVCIHFFLLPHLETAVANAHSMQRVTIFNSETGILQSLGIDLGAVAVFVWLVKRDLAARDKQMTRLLREEKLGILQIELANKKTLKLSQLRSFSRVVRHTKHPEYASKGMSNHEQLTSHSRVRTHDYDSCDEASTGVCDRYWLLELLSKWQLQWRLRVLSKTS